MSRIGRRVLQIPAGVKVNQQSNVINITGPKGSVELPWKENLPLKLKCDDGRVVIERTNDEKPSRMIHGTMNALVANALHGVVEPWVVKLNLVGVGYRASVVGKELVISLGYSHPVKITIPTEISVNCPSQTEINLAATDKNQVTQFASEIRKWRPPEPYKGKGVFYEGETIVRKVGKTAEGSKKA